MEPRALMRLEEIRRSPFRLGRSVTLERPGDAYSTALRGESLEFTPELLAHHQVVLGTTGAGKSKYLELLGRYLIDGLHGFTFIDPHGDTVEALLAYATRLAEERGDGYVIERLHYLKPSPDSIFSFDPFRFPYDSLPPERREIAFATWLHSTTDRVARTFFRGLTEGEVQVMMRLKRWLSDVLFVTGTPAENDARLTLADAAVLLDPRHKLHHEVLDRLRPRLPAVVVADFDLLHRLKRPQDEDHYLESTTNRIRPFFSPLVLEIFSGSAPSLDLAEIMRRRHILLVNLRETDFLSEEQGLVIAGLLINEIKSVCARIQHEHERTAHHLIIDEAGYYIGEDFKHILERARKWRLSLCLGGQSFSTFQKGDIDLMGDLLGLCRTVISFRQKNVDPDVESLGRFFAYPNYVLTEKMEVKDRPNPPEIWTLVDRNVSSSLQLGRSQSSTENWNQGVNDSSGNSSGTNKSISSQVNQATQQSDNWSAGRNASHTTSESRGESINHGQSLMLVDGRPQSFPSVSQQSSRQQGSSQTDGTSESQGGSSGTTQGRSDGIAHGVTEQTNRSHGSSSGVGGGLTSGSSATIGVSTGVTLKQHPMVLTREEWHPTGDPQLSLPYQHAIHEYLLTTAPDRIALVRTQIDGQERTIIFETAEVVDPYADSRERQEHVQPFLARLQASKDYLFAPGLPSESQAARLKKVLDRPSAQPGEGSVENQSDFN